MLVAFNRLVLRNEHSYAVSKSNPLMIAALNNPPNEGKAFWTTTKLLNAQDIKHAPQYCTPEAQINNVLRLNESENTTAIAFAVLNPLNAQDMNRLNAVFIPAKKRPRRGSRFHHGQIEFTPK